MLNQLLFKFPRDFELNYLLSVPGLNRMENQ